VSSQNEALPCTLWFNKDHLCVDRIIIIIIIIIFWILLNHIVRPTIIAV